MGEEMTRPSTSAADSACCNDPEIDETPPRQAARVNVQVPVRVTAERSAVTVALRRRREASQRMAPLPDGYRDPLDKDADRPSAKRPAR